MGDGEVEATYATAILTQVIVRMAAAVIVS